MVWCNRIPATTPWAEYLYLPLPAVGTNLVVESIPNDGPLQWLVNRKYPETWLLLFLSLPLEKFIVKVCSCRRSQSSIFCLRVQNDRRFPAQIDVKINQKVYLRAPNIANFLSLRARPEQTLRAFPKGSILRTKVNPWLILCRISLLKI